jgi:hypothetical protein
VATDSFQILLYNIYGYSMKIPYIHMVYKIIAGIDSKKQEVKFIFSIEYMEILIILLI